MNFVASCSTKILPKVGELSVPLVWVCHSVTPATRSWSCIVVCYLWVG